MTIQTVPVDEGKDSAHLPSGDISSSVFQVIQYVSRGNDGWRPDFLRRKTPPRRTAMPRKRGSLRHLHGSRSAVFVNSAHQVSTSVNIHKCQGHVTLSICQGHMTFLSARGTNFHLKIMRPHHWCWNPASEVWLALLLLPQPHSWSELGQCILIPFAIHYVYLTIFCKF